MSDLPNEIERATVNAKQMAHSLGVRIWLYQDLTGRPVFRPIHPARAEEHLTFVESFEPPAKEIPFDHALPVVPPPATA